MKEVRAPKVRRSFNVYEVGTCSQIGDFVVRGDSAWDFAEAFDRAGFPMDARDPLFLRDDLTFCNDLCHAAQAEQVEMTI